MKKSGFLKKAVFIVAAALALSCVSPQNVVPVEAASAAYLSKLKVPFGVKTGKKYHFSQLLTGVGKKDISWTLRSAKGKKAKKKGYRELEVVLDFASDISLSPIEVDAITSTDYSKKNRNSGANMWYAVVDGKTGLDVEEKNKSVSVKSKRLSYHYKTFYGVDKTVYQNAVDAWSIRVTIVYPEKNKDLCLGFGGGNVLLGDLTDADARFWRGKVPFGKTTLYKKGKNNSRWVRLSSLGVTKKTTKKTSKKK